MDVGEQISAVTGGGKEVALPREFGTVGGEEGAVPGEVGGFESGSCFWGGGVEEAS